MAHHVITIAQQKGGAGKTTLTAHLAVSLSQRGFRVGLIDIDPQGSLSHWHGVREEKFGEGYTGLTFSAVSGWRVGSEIARMRHNHDFILIDSPPHVETEARTAIRNAELVLIPVQPSPTDLWATQGTVDLAASDKVEARIVLNRVPPKAKLAEAIAGELRNIANTRLGNRVLFASALLEGKGVTETAPSSPAALEIKALTAEVLGLCSVEKDAETIESEKESVSA